MPRTSVNPRSSAIGQWAPLGPYYCIFPIDFARNTIRQFCPPAGAVLDPFCGRGTAPFLARTSGRLALGCDVSPVAWVFSAAKIDPEPNIAEIFYRLGELASDRRREDFEFDTEFMSRCFTRDVYGYLKAARRSLDWRGSRTDRTIMAVILTYLHDKLPYGLSNQMPRAKSMAPDYSLRWWNERDSMPPNHDPDQFILERIQDRYQYGLPEGAPAEIRLGDAREVLPAAVNDDRRFDLLLTSPPYAGVTNYRADQWLRLWMLGDNPYPHSSDTSQKYGDKKAYVEMLSDVFGKCSDIMRPECAVYIRTDTRPFTRAVTAALLERTWPDHKLAWRADTVAKTQTHFCNGVRDEKAGETDIIALPHNQRTPDGFRNVPDEIIVAGRDKIEHAILSV